MGLETAQPTRAVIFEKQRAVPAANRLGDEGYRLQDCDGRPRRPGRINIAGLVRSAARKTRLGQVAGLIVKEAARPFGKNRLGRIPGICNFAWADMATELEAAADLLCGRAAGGARSQDADATMLCAMAKTLRHRCRVRGRQSGAAAATAATAT